MDDIPHLHNDRLMQAIAFTCDSSCIISSSLMSSADVSGKAVGGMPKAEKELFACNSRHFVAQDMS